MGEKLGCVIFQLPPNFHYSEEHLARIADSLDNSFLNVVEFRDDSWWNEEVYTTLGKKNITFCGMSHPTLPKQIVSNAPLLYYRMHGEGALYASNYENTQLSVLVEEINTNRSTKEVYIFFNNDINTSAVYNASEMLNIIKARKLETF